MSVALWAVGLAGFSFMEWYNTLLPLGPAGKAMAGWFQSVTARTAGFNTIDFGQVRGPTLLLTMGLMLIGGAPGSCAGGIKVTTALVIFAALRARTRGRESVALLFRTVPRETVTRAMQILMLSLLFLIVVTISLAITEESPSRIGGRADRLTVLWCESISAFATVGLSTGITPTLTPTGQFLIILTMFVGRLGPLAVALAVIRPSPQSFEYPKEELAVG
jgi:trk system potassium uptake protein TrkH